MVLSLQHPPIPVLWAKLLGLALSREHEAEQSSDVFVRKVGPGQRRGRTLSNSAQSLGGTQDPRGSPGGFSILRTGGNKKEAFPLPPPPMRRGLGWGGRTLVSTHQPSQACAQMQLCGWLPEPQELGQSLPPAQRQHLQIEQSSPLTKRYF